MQNSQIIKAGYFVVLFLTVMLLPVNSFSAAQQANNWLDEPVTIRFQDEPLSKVLGKVSKQTGIAILYDQELANDKVSGNYKDVKASDVINRLFSGKNKSIQVGKVKKNIIVKTFGSKDFIWAGKASGDNDNTPLLLDKISLDKIRALQTKQYQEYKEEISDDNAIIERNMTRAQLRTLVQQQNNQFEERQKDDNEVIEGDKTRAQLREIVKKQNEEFAINLTVDDQVLTGDKTRSQLREFVQKQNKEFADELSDNNQVIEGGLTRAELRRLIQNDVMADDK